MVEGHPGPPKEATYIPHHRASTLAPGTFRALSIETMTLPGVRTAFVPFVIFLFHCCPTLADGWSHRQKRRVEERVKTLGPEGLGLDTTEREWSGV